MDRRQAMTAVLAATVFPKFLQAKGTRQPGYALGERIPLRAEWGALYFEAQSKRLHVEYPALPVHPDDGMASRSRYRAFYKYGRCRGWRYIARLLPPDDSWIRVEPWGVAFSPGNPNGGLRIWFSRTDKFVLSDCTYLGSETRPYVLGRDLREDRDVLYHAWCDNPAPEEVK